ncbi:hypothetical protein DFP92_105131 [Yoonia sediminilitoris]|uniref:Uncharacterized protein n=1 Tax=Yoonia sediminilitoris TaxID=1286148 RepID=A0A2T6KHD7_9RHOB|nr:hypothetical protein C8N45_105131 [Yoonia sediminilitoris]RCW95625.1 hypothetical protein DFP92_105131 [Yoonia sediminilitoris]
MWALVIVESHPLADARLTLRSDLPGVQVYAFVFQCSLQPLEEDVVKEAALSIHRDARGPDLAGMPIHDGDQIQEPASHGLIAIGFVPLCWPAVVGLVANRPEPRRAHQSPDKRLVNSLAIVAQAPIRRCPCPICKTAGPACGRSCAPFPITWDCKAATCWIRSVPSKMASFGCCKPAPNDVLGLVAFVGIQRTIYAGR